MTWSGECSPRELLGIQTVRTVLRRITPRRQRTGQRFGGELIAEAALISGLGRRRLRRSAGHCVYVRCTDSARLQSLSETPVRGSDGREAVTWRGSDRREVVTRR